MPDLRPAGPPGQLVGLVADTHGLVRPRLLEALRGAVCILHAGDVGRREVLRELERLAPVLAVRGNVDHGDWAAPLPLRRTVEIGGRRVHVLHVLGDLDADPRTERIDAVVYGHSHRPSIERRDRVLYVNPGAAGPRRFSLPVTAALLRIGPQGIEAELGDLAAR